MPYKGVQRTQKEGKETERGGRILRKIYYYADSSDAKQPPFVRSNVRWYVRYDNRYSKHLFNETEKLMRQKGRSKRERERERERERKKERNKKGERGRGTQTVS